MVVFPESAHSILGFDAIRQRVAANLLSPDGAETFDAEPAAQNAAEALTRLRLVAEFQELLRLDVPVRVGAAFDVSSLLAVAKPRGAMLDAEDLRRVGDLMAGADDLRSILATRADDYPELANVVGTMQSAGELLPAIERAIDERGEVSDDASAGLRRVRREIRKTESSLRSSLDRALASARANGFDGGDQPTVRNGRMVIPIRVEAKRKVSGFVHDVSASGQTAFIEPTASLELNNSLNELRATERKEIRLVLTNLTDLVREHAAALASVSSVLLALDVVRAKAVFGNALNCVVPVLTDGSDPERQIELRGARHPILYARMLQEVDAEQAVAAIVPLDLSLGVDHVALVLSGPNAGGKTVVLKTLGLFVLMVAHGIPVPARQESVLFLPDRLMLDIGDEQSVENDLSTFSARVEHLKHVVDQAGSGSLVLIDEAGTGTDPDEGAALAQAVLEHLADAGATTIASTHHQRLKVFAMEHPRVANGSMLIDPDSLVPTYQFQPGVAGSSYGFAVARRNGMADDVIQRAEALAGDRAVALDALLAELSGRIEELKEEQSSVAAERKSLAATEEKLKSTEAALLAERKKLKQSAARKAGQLIDAANARIERTIQEIVESGADKKVTRTARVQLAEMRGKLEEEGRPDDDKTLAGLSTAKLAAGDSVVLDGGETTAEVVSVQGNKVEIAAGSMRMRVDRGRLRKVGGRAPRKAFVGRVVSGGSEGDATKAISEMTLRLDLRGARVEEALWEVTRYVDRAITSGLQQVEILHGKGTGALRSAIREYLATRDDVAHTDDAELQQGGSGVTVVNLK